jgi:chaperone BCS1
MAGTESDTPLERLRDTLSGSHSDRTLVGRVLGAYAVAQSGISMWRTAQKWIDNRRSYTVSVRSDDPIYPDVHDWLLSTMTADARRAVVARSRFVLGRDVFDPDEPSRGDAPAPRLHLAYNDSRSREVQIDGHTVRVSVNKIETPSMAGPRMMKPDEIEFLSRSEGAQRAVIAHLEGLVRSHRPDRNPVLYLLNSWGSWSCRSDLPQRDIDTVVLAPGQSERLLGDLQTFLAAERDYNRLGIPWHRGYLLHGPPGTGKTSTVRALATRLGMDLWYAPLSDLDKDTSLMSLVAEVRPRSMLLLEDIDAFHAATDRDTGPGEVSMSGLLNALDGVSTPHGLIVVMTTNRPEMLDEAVTRAGRVDVTEEFTLPDENRVRRLFEVVYGRPPSRHLVTADRSPADVVEVLKRHLHDPDTAERELAAGQPVAV